MTNKPIVLPPEGYVRVSTVLAVFPVSKSKWWDGVKKKEYPQPTKLGPNVTVWDVNDIRTLLERYKTTNQSLEA